MLFVHGSKDLETSAGYAIEGLGPGPAFVVAGEQHGRDRTGRRMDVPHHVDALAKVTDGDQLHYEGAGRDIVANQTRAQQVLLPAFERQDERFAFEDEPGRGFGFRFGLTGERDGQRPDTEP